tara:strand:- start:195 stop:869 length:675 start_codon:yes stop_codon:yes gene_type:complete
MNSVFKFLLLILFVWSGCAENSVEPEEELPPIVPITSNNILPLAIGNQWTYVDSLFFEDTVLVETYTVRIQSKRHIEDEEFIDRNLVWWKFNGRFNPSITAVEFAAEEDTVYSLQKALGPDRIVSINPTEYIIPEMNDTLSFIASLDGDGAYIKNVFKKDSMISYANGIRNSYLDIFYSHLYIHQEIVVPGIGMIYLEIINIPSVTGQNWVKRRLILTDHNITE